MKPCSKPFPETGTEASLLMAEMQRIKRSDASWREGKIFGYVYHPGEEAAGVAEEAYRMFWSENALNPSLFSSLRRFENETVQMMTDLLHGGPDASGTFTSGGTESILMAVKSARDRARALHPEITSPEMVIPESVHPAFLKAADYLGVRAVLTPVRQDKRADAGAMEKAVSRNTILISGSAPCFPHGVIDPIEEIGEMAIRHNIPFHVDACMGGMLIPFAEEAGYRLPRFDFRVPGVTSVSADIHKYGYSPKGASVIIYANRSLRKYQFFVHTDWSGGLYGSPSLLGSRSGGPVASAWAVMKHIGREGYVKMAAMAMETSRKLQAGINAIPGLHVVSNPDITIFAFTSADADIFEIGDALTQQGWFLDRIQFPNALHLTVANHNIIHAESFLSTLEKAVATVKKKRISSASSHFLVSFVKGMSRVLPEKWFRKITLAASKMTGSKDSGKQGMSAAMYGITASVENRSNVHELVLGVLDSMY